MYQHGIYKRFLTEIGHVTVSFALLNDTLELLIISLVGQSQRIGQVISSEVSFRKRRDLIISLAEERIGETKDMLRLKNLMNIAGDLEAERNRISHSGWGTDSKFRGRISRTRHTAKERHGFKMDAQDYTIRELRKVGDKMLRLSSRIEGWWERLAKRGRLPDPYAL